MIETSDSNQHPLVTIANLGQAPGKIQKCLITTEVTTIFCILPWIRPSMTHHCGVCEGEMGKGRMLAQALNRNPGGTLGGLQQSVEAGWGPWWCTRGQPQVRENLGNQGGIFDCRADGQRAAALWTEGAIDGEDAFESLRPAHAGPCGGRGLFGLNKVPVQNAILHNPTLDKNIFC